MHSKKPITLQMETGIRDFSCAFFLSIPVKMDPKLILTSKESDEFLAEEFACFLMLKCQSLKKASAFDLDRIAEEDCDSFFRFSEVDLPKPRLAPGIPDKIQTSNGSVLTGKEGLWVPTRKLVYPNRCIDI